MSINDDVQGLSPGALVTLYELDLRDIGGDVMRFHGYQTGPVKFQGKTYSPWAIAAEGFERTGEPQQPMPTLSVGNIGKDTNGKPIAGVISSLCYALQDLVGATVTRRRTFSKYLDGRPTADPLAEFPPEIWIVEQKSSESAELVTFSLSSPMDFDDIQMPARQIVANVCPWLWIGGYRGPYCGYTGSRMFDKDDKPVSSITLDQCSGLLRSCALRFGEGSALNFGGFPSSDKVNG
ncbi:phage minor tail protein L [Paenalcaligenes hominis]|uniref:Phage minor tail protein L n=1 Tax=Paenalcaligenes hominis TaxID=643674 RepID=A0A1U9JY64_9BURK|nr:phage minor tail protein L [Paenalcaligenes hominis]AQS50718.1 phage minor tail protein L [Paenalcaligenes hominis]